MLKEDSRAYEKSNKRVPDDETINVYLIGHTHDDTGWLQTTDQYYVKQIHYILDSVMSALTENEDRKFTYVEQDYFQKWWNEISEKKKEQVRQLVKEGRLEFNLGGWCMTDEAGAHYEDIINEMTLGHKYIYDEFGIRPTVGWHIDPFGHSSQVASLYSQMGFDGYSIFRIHYDDVERRKENKTLEFIWRGSKSLDNESDLFTHYLESGYHAAGEANFFGDSCGMCFFNSDDNSWFAWDDSLPTYKTNQEYHMKRFVDMVRTRTAWFDNGNNLLLPWGADFTFINAFIPFDNMDKFIEYVNSHENQYHIHIQYAVLSDYIKAVHEYHKKWTVKTDDFFPYARGSNSYWTGYYTSRDRLKGLVREKMNELSNAEMYLALSKAEKKSLNFAELYSDIMKLRKAQGEVQHHDAITGTEKQAVANDYNVQLVNGAYYANKAASTVLDIYTTLENINKNSTEVFPLLTEENRIAVVLSNTIAWNRTEVIQLISPRSDVGIYDKEGKPLEVQINEIPEFSYDRRNGTYYVYFLIEIPAMGYTTVYIKVNKDSIVTKPIEDTFISNNKMKLTLNNGYIEDIILSNSTHYPLYSSLYQYKSNVGYPATSGAYAFTPGFEGSIGVSNSDNNIVMGEGRIDSILEGDHIVHLISIVGDRDCDDIIDTNLRGYDNKQIKYIVQRFDKNEGWGQHLQINTVSINLDKSPSNTLYGSTTISSSKEESQEIEINFSTPFKNNKKLYMFTTVSSEEQHLILCSVKSLSNSKAILLVRIYGASSWKKDVIINYIVFEEGSQPFDSYKDQIIYGEGEGILDTNNFLRLNIPWTQSLQSPRVFVQVYSDISISIMNRYIHTNEISFNMKSIDDNQGKSIKIMYFILPSVDGASPILSSQETINNIIIKGPLVEEIQQIYRKGYYSIYRLYKQGIQENILEINTEMNGIDDGREVVLQLNTNLKNEKTIYSDTIGMEQQKRVFNPLYSEPIPANIYPCVSRAYIEDKKENIRLTVLVDRAHGVSSQKEGRMEIMIKRRTIGDDGYGVGEPLTENDHVKEKFWFMFNTIEMSSILYKQLDLYLSHPPLPYYSIVNNNNINNNNINLQDQYSFIQSELPKNIQLLNFQLAGLYDKTYLLRFHHIYEKNECELAIPVEIDLSKLFKGFEIIDYEEKILTGMFNKEQVERERLRWDTEDNNNNHNDNDIHIQNNKSHHNQSVRGNKNMIITIKPMEFKTFAVTIN
ncbi:hypothetical protein WA158_003124 [Blastocystis sp. Blastoise]